MANHHSIFYTGEVWRAPKCLLLESQVIAQPHSRVQLWRATVVSRPRGLSSKAYSSESQVQSRVYVSRQYLFMLRKGLFGRL